LRLHKFLDHNILSSHEFIELAKPARKRAAAHVQYIGSKLPSKAVRVVAPVSLRV